MKARAKFYTTDISPLAAFIRDLCVERGLSFTQACVQMGISTATISNLARDKYEPSIGTLNEFLTIIIVGNSETKLEAEP